MTLLFCTVKWSGDISFSTFPFKAFVLYLFVALFYYSRRVWIFHIVVTWVWNTEKKSTKTYILTIRLQLVACKHNKVQDITALLGITIPILSLNLRQQGENKQSQIYLYFCLCLVWMSYHYLLLVCFSTTSCFFFLFALITQRDGCVVIG